MIDTKHCRVLAIVLTALMHCLFPAITTLEEVSTMVVSVLQIRTVSLTQVH